MAIYRNVQMSFWTDTKIIDDFSPEEKYLYLYFLTNPHTNLSGCYEISLKQIEYETGISTKNIKVYISRLQDVHRVIIYANKTREILIIHWSKYNWTASEKYRKPLFKEIQAIKDPNFKRYLSELFNGIDTVSIPYASGIDITDTVSDTDTVINISKRSTPKFKKPTADEVRAYCNERRNGIDAQSFIDFYDARGWKLTKGVGMKDWKAAIRTWEKNRKSTAQKVKPPERNYDMDALELKLLSTN